MKIGIVLNTMKQKIDVKYSCGLLILSFLIGGCQLMNLQAGADPLASAPDTASVEEDGSAKLPSGADENARNVEEAIADFTPEPDELDRIFVEERYALYNDKQSKWQMLKNETALFGAGFAQPERFVSCYQLVQSIAGGYRELQSEPDHGYFVTSKYDIRFLAEECDTVFGVQASYLPTMLDQFRAEAEEKGRDIVFYYAEKQDFSRVISAVENMPGDGVLSPELQRIYGRALVEMDRFGDAARVLSLVVAGLDHRGQWPLRLEIAELLIASGEYEEARNQYLAIAEVLSSWEETHKVVTDQLALLSGADDHPTEISLYSKCLSAYLSFDGHAIPLELEQNVQQLQAEYPSGIHADAALKLYRRAEEQVRNDINLRLLQVQKIKDEKRFQVALDRLQEMKQAHQPADVAARIDEMANIVTADHNVYLQLEKEKRTQSLADRWQEGLNLLDMQMYDESIAIFSGLLGTEYDSRAAKKIERGSVLAATALRSEAANLFVQARRTTDYNSRITLLNQSRTLLQEILDKYPQVDLAEKAAVHITVIDEQLQDMGVFGE
jgi:tetratricopeptide (TPR) repeat protein